MVKKKAVKKKIVRKVITRRKKKASSYHENAQAQNLQQVITKFDTYFRKIFQEMEQIRALVHAHSIGAQNVYNEFLKMKERFAEMEGHFSRFGIR